MSAAPLLVRTGLAARIVDIVRDRIVAGELSEDGPIRQDALAAELGVSKIPLREAFAKLEEEGLVLAKANRGYFVRPLSAAEAFDVFELRLKIEPDAVAAASIEASPADILVAQAALAALNASAAKGKAAAGPLNRAFHMALVRPCARPVTIQTTERLQVIAERYVVHHLQASGRPDRAIGEHQALFAAWEAKDRSAAAALCSAHIQGTLDDLTIEFGRETR